MRMGEYIGLIFNIFNGYKQWPVFDFGPKQKPLNLVTEMSSLNTVVLEARKDSISAGNSGKLYIITFLLSHQ